MANVYVKMVVEVHVPLDQPWGGKVTAEELYKLATEQVEARVRQKLGELKWGVRAAKCTAVIAETEIG